MPQLQIIPELFEFKNYHFYYGGARIPSIGRILKEAGHVKLDGIPPDVLERKRQIGVALDEATNLWDAGKSVQCDPAVQPYFDSYRTFLDRHKPKILAIQKPRLGRVDNHLYGAVEDRLMEWPDKYLTVDLKTTWKLYLSARVQVTGIRKTYHGEGRGYPQPALLWLRKPPQEPKLVILGDKEVTEEYEPELERIVRSYHWKLKHKLITLED